MHVSKGFERYLRHHRAAGSSPPTLEWHTQSLGQFLRYLADHGHTGEVEDLAADDLRGFIDALRAKGLAQSSVSTKMCSVKAWGRWLLAEEYVPRDPFAKVKRIRKEDKAKETLTPGEVDRLLAVCDRKRVTGARDFAAMLLLFSTGLRAAEIMGLAVEDVDFDKGLVLVRRGKGGKFRQVPLSRPVEKALLRYLAHPNRGGEEDSGSLFLTDEGTPLTLGGLQQMFKRRGASAGIHANPHKWRHSAAIQYLRGGGRVEMLKTMLGHSTLDMTLHYARIAGVDLTTAHETCDPARSLKTRV